MRIRAQGRVDAGGGREREWGIEGPVDKHGLALVEELLGCLRDLEELCHSFPCLKEVRVGKCPSNE